MLASQPPAGQGRWPQLPALALIDKDGPPTSRDDPAASVNVHTRPHTVGIMRTYPAWAEAIARAHLETTLPRRWAHTQGAAARARSLAPILGENAGLLEAAAWLHDIGYAPRLGRRLPSPRRRPLLA